MSPTERKEGGVDGAGSAGDDGGDGGDGCEVQLKEKDELSYFEE